MYSVFEAVCCLGIIFCAGIVALLIINSGNNSRSSGDRFFYSMLILVPLLICMGVIISTYLGGSTSTDLTQNIEPQIITISEKQVVSGHYYLFSDNDSLYELSNRSDYNIIETNKSYLLRITDGYIISEVIGEWKDQADSQT